MAATQLPQFSTLNLTTYVEQLDTMLQDNLEKIKVLLTQKTFDWNNLMQPLEEIDDQMERFLSPMIHQHSVVNSNALRACYQACLPKLSAYDAAIGHNQTLYEAIKSIDQSQLNATQKKIVNDSLFDFELAGVALSQDKKHRFEAIQTRLSDLSNQFDNNLLDAGQAFSMHITDEKRLKGLPEHALHTAKELAQEKNQEGWVLNLEFPCYLAIITYADDRDLREAFHLAYSTRASDQGPYAGKFDNTDIINETLALRHEKAQLLGFANYAELSVARKMAESPKHVTDFLNDLGYRAHHQAQEEINALRSFAKQKYDLDELAPWDISYYSEKMRQKHYELSQEDLRPYFPQDKVMAGLFTIIQRLYGITLEPVDNVDTWHPDVVCYRLIDETKQERGFVYVDLFARQQKNGGAWMDSFQTRRVLANGVQLPIATLTCNFAKPAANKKAVLSHDEVRTLFHEFGHCLHHLLTKVDYFDASGIHGVEWDAVELPSQIFENWCWEQNALDLLAQHVDTGEPLPETLYQKLIAAKNFQSAMAMLRQIEFSLVDFRIHEEYKDNDPDFVTKIIKDVRSKINVLPIAPYNRFQHSFSHIFAGGYDAGYYSYKWAEVLSSDAYARFEDEGIFNEKTGRDFLHCVLEVGGSKKAAEAFEDFRGRPVKIDALLRHNGIRA